MFSVSIPRVLQLSWKSGCCKEVIDKTECWFLLQHQDGVFIYGKKKKKTKIGLSRVWELCDIELKKEA